MQDCHSVNLATAKILQRRNWVFSKIETSQSSALNASSDEVVGHCTCPKSRCSSSFPIAIPGKTTKIAKEKAQKAKEYVEDPERARAAARETAQQTAHKTKHAKEEIKQKTEETAPGHTPHLTTGTVMQSLETLP